jgi:hypothetical protein
LQNAEVRYSIKYCLCTNSCSQVCTKERDILERESNGLLYTSILFYCVFYDAVHTQAIITASMVEILVHELATIWKEEVLY